MGFKFEELIAWQKALDLTVEVDKLTKEFPSNERFVLTSQLKRAVDSIALNIAEGSTGQSNKQFRSFLGYAIGSGVEVIACLHIAKKRGLISDSDFKKLYAQTEKVVKITQGLRNSIKEK